MNAPPRDDLGREIDRCSQWLIPALEHAMGTHTMADVEEGIREGRMQLWPGKQSAAVTEVVCYPQRRILHLFLAGGDLEELREMEDCAVEFAKHMQCEAMSIAGRRGWVRAFKDKGYEEYLTTVIRPVEVEARDVYNARAEG